jgi:uncharacterized membrane protein
MYGELGIDLLDVVLSYIKIFIELIGVVIIVAASLVAVYELLTSAYHKKLNLSYVRYQFGTSVTLGLEFLIGADIIGSLVNPNYYNMGILAIVVLIRTVLSYFITLELARLTPEQKKHLS